MSDLINKEKTSILSDSFKLTLMIQIIKQYLADPTKENKEEFSKKLSLTYGIEVKIIEEAFNYYKNQNGHRKNPRRKSVSKTHRRSTKTGKT